MIINAQRVTARLGNAGLHGALVTAWLAWAAPVVAQTAAELTRPASTIEVGIGGTSDGSYKAGEFNGLQKKGAFAIGDFDIRGGGAYDSGDALRYRLRGTDLGLDTRSISADIGAQGRYRLTFGFDQLRRNRSDSYQTPLIGAGSATLTLPSSWLVPVVASSTATNNAATSISARGLTPSIGTAGYIDTQTTSPTLGTIIAANGAQQALVNAASAADLPAFHHVNIDTTRTRFDAGVSFSLGEQAGVDAWFKPEHKSGTKLMGTVSRNTGGDIATIIPDRIDTNTNQAGANLTFTGAKGYFQAGYYGSYFSNNVTLMSWQNWATAGLTTNTMGSAPSNTYSQFSGSGAFTLTKGTKVSAYGSYGRNTQNDSFLTDSSTPVVPVGSLNGLVVTEAFNVKLASTLAKQTTFVAAYKFDNRDNRTPVNIFQYADAGEAAAANANFPAGTTLGPVLAQNANANRPYSKKQNLFTADLDWGYAAGQHLKAGFEYHKIDRQCPGSWIACADAASTNENILRAEWRASANSAFTARLGYEYARRRDPSYNENAFLALVPYANVVPAGQTMSAYQALTQSGLTGYGPVLGYNGGTFVNSVFFPNNNALANALYANNNRISELVGMRRYYVSDRNRNKVRAAVTWLATEVFTLQANVDYNRDEYPTAVYGLQKARTWASTVDGSFELNSHVSADVFYTYEQLNNATAGNSYTANSNTANVNGATGLSGNACDGYTTILQRNNNNKLDPCLNWFTDMADGVKTFGAGLRGKGTKMEVDLHVILSAASTTNNVTGGNWANNPLALPGAAASAIAAYFISAAPLPEVTTTMSELRFNARYIMSKAQSLRFLYSYMHASAADWIYAGMQFGAGTPSGVLPTNEQPFNYGVHVFGVSWVLTF